MINNLDIENFLFKPNVEFIMMARKPLNVTGILDSIRKYNVGGINIDECRVPAKQGEYDIRHYTKEDCFQNLKPKESKFQVKPQPNGRFPANTILTYDESNIDEVCDGFPENKASIGVAGYSGKYAGTGWKNTSKAVISIAGYTDSGSASRYFKNCQYTNKDIEIGVINKMNDIEKNYRIINGNCLEELDKLEENSVDAIVTDPPYELNFMNKGWDNAGVSFQKETWEKCLRVLKPRWTSISVWR